MSIQEAWTFMVESVFPHWPGLFFAVFIAVIAQTLKSRILTLELAMKYGVIFWARRVFPIILLFLGLIPGLTWPGEVVPGIEETVEKCWYFIGCSGVSIIGFNVFKQWVKKKYDVDVGLSSIAPPPPPTLPKKD